MSCRFRLARLFWIGGALPAGLAILLLALLPESPRFLVRRPERWNELTPIAGAACRARSKTRLCSLMSWSSGSNAAKASALCSSRSASATRLALWGGVLSLPAAVYTAFNWLPAMLTSEGPGCLHRVSGLTVYNSRPACSARASLRSRHHAHGFALADVLCAPEAPPARFFCN